MVLGRLGTTAFSQPAPAHRLTDPAETSSTDVSLRGYKLISFLPNGVLPQAHPGNPNLSPGHLRQRPLLDHESQASQSFLPGKLLLSLTLFPALYDVYTEE